MRAGKKDRFSLRADLDQTIDTIPYGRYSIYDQTTGKLQIVNRERSNFVPFLNRTAVLTDESESVAQPTPGTSIGTNSATIPPVLTEQDIPGAALNEPLDQHTMPELRWWLLCHGIQVTASLRMNQLINRFSQYRRYSRAVSATACARSGLSHRLALVHEDGCSI